MRLDKTVTLGGDPGRPTLAALKSAGGSEVYAAATVGLKPSRIFTIWASEYQDDDTLTYLGSKHKIIRTYDTGDGFLELSCEVRLGG